MDAGGDEQTPPTLVFNGDFHWVDAEPDWFAEIERGVSPHRALRGNVETEISRVEDIGAGCGCDYPETVSEDVVRRSNATLLQLRAERRQTGRARLRALPMHLVAQVGGLRVGIVHGDAQSLAGWHFAQGALDDPRQRAWRDDIASASRIDVFASTHTGEAALRDFTLPPRRLTVVNNGAAGMPNFAGTRFRRHHAHRHDVAAASAALRACTQRRPHRRAPGPLRPRRSSPRGSCSAGRKARRPTSPIGSASIAGPISPWPRQAAMKLSIIMPVLNEAAGIEAALRALAPFRARGVEVIVVDGGSHDGTAALARPLADRVLSAPRGRAAQMNAGAAAATGDVLLFLHADTRLPQDADRLILDGLKDHQWGRFDVRFDGGGLLRLVAMMMNTRSRLTGIATGDQAMFVTRAAFERGRRLSAHRADGRRRAVGAAQAARPPALPVGARHHLGPPLARGTDCGARSC